MSSWTFDNLSVMLYNVYSEQLTEKGVRVMRKYAETGKPNFYFMTDEQVRSNSYLLEELISAYKGIDDKVVEVLERAWRDLSSERIRRTTSKPTVVKEEPKTEILRPKRVLIKTFRK